MGAFEILIIRVVLSVIFAFLICRFFFEGTPIIKVFGLATIMLGLAYLLEYLRKRDKGESRGN